MATRNSVARLIPGNTLGSILRETAREARRTSRNSAGAQGEQGEQGEPGTPADLKAQYTAVLTTGASGTVHWNFPAAFTAPPRVFAQVVSTMPFWCSVNTVTTTGVNVTVWNISAVGTPGITVNVTAIEA